MFKGEVKGCYTEFCRFVSKEEKDHLKELDFLFVTSLSYS